MSESTGIDDCDYAQLRIGIAIALSHDRTLALETTVLRIVRIVLLVVVPTVALSALVTACSDDTTNQTVQDMSGTVKDMALPVVHDMALPHD